MNAKLLRKHLIERDGKSINGKVKQTGEELRRIADAVSMHPRSLYQIAEGWRETKPVMWDAIAAAINNGSKP
jgi:hypothetical protein